jgi:hypothetical protein
MPGMTTKDRQIRVCISSMFRNMHAERNRTNRVGVSSISSMFRNMQAERDYLAKFNFPQLRGFVNRAASRGARCICVGD